MFKYVALVFALLSVTASEEARRHKYEDPFTTLDRHISHTLAYHYMWPWSQLFRAAAILDAEDSLEEPQIVSDNKKFEINLNVRRFKPDELRIKVKNRYIIVEGKHKVRNEDDKRFLANHFMQRFVLPPGSKPEEVTAVLNENGILSIAAPKHELPPPPPERDVPIEVRLPEKRTERPEEILETSTARTEEVQPSIQTSSATPLEQLELVEATTHVGKIRKKELKTTTKTTKDNEVTKGIDGNGLDYALVETEE